MKVLPKLVRTLRLFSDGGTLDFAEITARTGLTRSNQAHILHALCENRLLEKSAFGRYRAGAGLWELAGAGGARAALRMLSTNAASAVADTLHELGVVVCRSAGRRITLAKVQPERTVRLAIADRPMEHSGWYSLSAGRLLLALQSDDEIAAVVRQTGLPSPEEWPEVHDMPSLLRAAAAIREAGQVVLLRENGKITSVAVPVPDASGAPVLALSTVYITGSRDDSDDAVLKRLGAIAEDLAAQLRFHGIALDALPEDDFNHPNP